MAEFTFADLIQSAADAPASAGSGPELDAAGKFRSEVVFGNHKMSSNGKLQVGLKFQVKGGPKDGSTIWANQTLSPESPAALDIFFRTFEALGISRDAWAKYGADMEAAGAAASAAVVGAVVDITVRMGKAQNGYAAKLEVKRIDAASASIPTQTAPPVGGNVGPGPAIPAPPPAAAPVVPLTPPRAPF